MKITDQLCTDLPCFGQIENPALDGQSVGIQNRVVAPISSGLVPPVANLLGRYGNGICRHHLGLGERQALLPEIGHDPLAFGAEQLPFQPGFVAAACVQPRRQAWNFSTQARSLFGTCAFFQAPAAILLASARVG